MRIFNQIKCLLSDKILFAYLLRNRHKIISINNFTLYHFHEYTDHDAEILVLFRLKYIDVLKLNSKTINILIFEIKSLIIAFNKLRLSSIYLV